MVEIRKASIVDLEIEGGLSSSPRLLSKTRWPMDKQMMM